VSDVVIGQANAGRTPLPAISVVIPTRHRLDSLARCLERLAPGVQTLAADRYEVIVTDDGADPTAEAMVRERFPQARWTAGPRRGPAANRNNGASKASGNWLIFIDDDCLPSQQLLSEYAAFFAKGGRAAEGAIHAAGGDPSSDLAECPVNVSGGCFWSANIGLDRATYDATGGFDETYKYAAHEDVALRERVLQLTPIAFLSKAIVDHLVRQPTLIDKLRRLPQEWDAWAHHVSADGGSGTIKRRSPLGFFRVEMTRYARGVPHHLMNRRPRSAVVAAAYLLAGVPYVTWCMWRSQGATTFSYRHA
jgi:hypothetical protein